MKFAVDRFGKLDCVVNNAGAGGESGQSRELQSRDLIDQSLSWLRGPFLGIKYAVPHMQSGTIINIASISGITAGSVATLELRRSLAIAFAKLDRHRAEQTKNEAME